MVRAQVADMAAPPAQKGKGLKKKTKDGSGSGSSTPNATASTGTNVASTGAATGTPTGKLWEVETLDTVIFPEGEPQSCMPFSGGNYDHLVM